MMQHRLSQEEKEGFGARGAQEGLGFPRERAVGRREWVPPRDREGGRQAFQSSTECGNLWNCCLGDPDVPSENVLADRSPLSD